MDAAGRARLLRAHLGRAGDRRQRDRGRLDRSCRRRCSRCRPRRIVSIRLAPGPGPDEVIAPAVERLAARGARRRAPMSRSSAGRRRRPGLVRPTRRRSSSRWTRSSGSSAPAAARPLGRHAADRPGARRPGHPDDHHRLRADREQHPLAERAGAGRVHAARRAGGERLLPRLRTVARASRRAPRRRSCRQDGT